MDKNKIGCPVVVCYLSYDSRINKCIESKIGHDDNNFLLNNKMVGFSRVIKGWVYCFDEWNMMWYYTKGN